MKKYLLLLFLFLLSGCNYTELNQISIINLLSIDKIDHQYIISGIVIEDEMDHLKMVSGKGDTIASAINDLDLKLNKKIYLGHLKTIIISESLAKEGITPITDYFLKNEKIRDNFYLLLSEEEQAKDIVHAILDQKLSLNNMDTLVSASKLSSPTINNTINHFMQNLLEPGIEPSINYINHKLEIEHIGIFKNDKLKYKTKRSEMISILQKTSSQYLLPITCDYKTSILLQDLYVHYKKDKNSIIITVLGMTDENESCNFKNFEKVLNKQFKKDLNQTIQELQNMNTDILGVGYLLNSKERKKNYFQDIQIKIDTDIKVNNRNGEYYE